MRNKRGQVVFIAFMLGVVCFVLGLALTPALKDVIQDSTVMGVDGLDCDNVAITNQDKSICTQIDMFLPLFMGIIFGLGGSAIGYLAVR